MHARDEVLADNNNSKSPINESTEPVHTVNVDYTLEEDIERNGTALMEDLLNNLNKRYGIK